MPIPYRQRIQDWCTQNNITIPPGFYRHPASRYAAIDLAFEPPKLIATTWFKQENLLYYLTHNAERHYRILDFKERCELFLHDSRLHRSQSF